MKKIEAIRYMILALEREGGRKIQDMLKSVGVTGSQAEAIRVIDDHGPLSLKDLGSLLICEAGSPSRLVNTLVSEGYVLRKTSETDRRAITLSLSEEGERKAVEIKQVEAEFYQILIQQIPDEKINQLYEAMRDIVEHHPIEKKLMNRKFLN